MVMLTGGWDPPPDTDPASRSSIRPPIEPSIILRIILGTIYFSTIASKMYAPHKMPSNHGSKEDGID